MFRFVVRLVLLSLLVAFFYDYLRIRNDAMCAHNNVVKLLEQHSGEHK